MTSNERYDLSLKELAHLNRRFYDKQVKYRNKVYKVIGMIMGIHGLYGPRMLIKDNSSLFLLEENDVELLPDDYDERWERDYQTYLQLGAYI